MSELFLVDKVEVEKESAALPDAFERELALDVRASWVVEAPAGSGKTGLLIQRYLKLLADDSVEAPEQVLAITFTRKATAEMRERVLLQLQSAANASRPANSFDHDTRPLAQAVLDHDRSLGWNLLDQPARLNIRTIDSVCSEIANSLPLLSGSGGHRATVDDASPLYLIAARRTFMQLGDPADPELDRALRLVLLHRDGNLAECEKLLAEMLEHRDQWGDLVPFGRQRLDDASLDAHVLPRLELALERAICTALTRLAKTIPADILAQLTSAAAEMAHIAGYKGGVSPIAICAGKHASPQDTAEDLAHWRALIHLLIAPSAKSWRQVFSANVVKFDLSRSDQAHLKSLVEQLHHRDDLLSAICSLGSLPPARYPPDQWIVAKALFRILNRALAELQLVFAERSECDFAELALAARTALRHDEGARDLESASSIHLQHLLVDEMQDTSSSQYELIQMLTRNWDGHSQTVFLVGDPKQSIYLFRQARVERFLRTMHTGRLGDLSLGALRLTANFRSQATLVKQFNEDFESIFRSGTGTQHPEDVVFVSAVPVRPPEQASRSRVWNTTILPNGASAENATNKKRQRNSDAAAIRAIVEKWQSKPLLPNRKEPWKIAVLVRSRSHLEAIVAEFKGSSKEAPSTDDGRHSDPQQRISEESPSFALADTTSPGRLPIPYRAVDIEPLELRPEVQDLFALTRALLHPADRTAWLAILRAPWCGLSLSDLHIITGVDDAALSRHTVMQLLKDRGELLDPVTILRLERIWPVLEAALAAVGRLPLSQTVERTWRSLGGDTYLSTSELTNSRRYFQLLDELTTQTVTVDLAALQRKLTKLYAAPLLHSGAVDLLTMHKAKGLEWDVVIVPGLERPAGLDRNPLLAWTELDSFSAASEDEAAHIMLAPLQGKGEDSTELHNWMKSIKSTREAAERKRLFYVACTRAREELHLFASPSLSAKGEIQLEGTSLLKSAWPAAEPYFADSIAVLKPKGAASGTESESIAIAASALSLVDRHVTQPPTLQRLPSDFDPAARFRALGPLYFGKPNEGPAAPHFDRPAGSVAARAFGNTVHAFLERLTQALTAGSTAHAILTALPGWTPRIAALLRSEGLPPAMVERLAQRVIHALEATLKDPQGLWLLSPHEGAATEYALTAWTEQRTAVRIDRTFRAGPMPLEQGADHLWIVDYKTTNHGQEGLEAFLALERERYAPQLEAYAAVLQETEDKPAIRLALYYPLLSKLLWWQP